MKTKFWNGRLHFAVPPRRESPLSAVMRRIEQARTFKVASVDLAPPRSVAPSRSVAPPPSHVREPRARVRPRTPRRAASSGRDGSGRRDDGSGDSDGDGGGPDPPAPPPQRDAPTPLAVLIARAEARALLWRAGELDLTTACDELDAEAEVSGLLAAIGQDEVEAIIAAAFAAVCEPAVADGWTAAAVEYHAARGKRTLIVETAPEHLALLRDLMAADISLDHAVYELTAAPAAAHAVAAPTLAAVEYLIRENDAERLRQWLVQHSAQERAAILRHLEQRKKVRPCQKKT